jgi:hypothetical protein
VTIAARHRDRWSFVEGNDLRSRTTFSLLTQLYTLQAAPAGAVSPIVVLPSTR